MVDFMRFCSRFSCRSGTSRQRGFTLMELLVVMTILALLTTVGIVGYRRHTKHAKEAVLAENLFQLNHALEQHKADRGHYPSTLDTLKRIGYLRDLPIDPMVGNRDSWVTELEPGDPDQPNSEVGIFRVRSASTDIGENGLPYNEW
jgi:general secretion pathway protein G